MKHDASNWTELEQRLRREPASAPLEADAVPRLLRAVRAAGHAAEPAARAATTLWWAGAAAATALALLMTLQPAEQVLPAAAQVPAALPSVTTPWSLAALDAAAAAPLQQEWAGLRQDVRAAAGYLTGCLPTPGSLTPQG